jgi:pyrroloquinoline quinone (PQQ) biosynthesis protein C
MEHLLHVRQRVLEGIVSVEAVSRVLDGRLDPAVYISYLTNVFHYARHSATVIALAGARAVQRHPELARYLMRHADEELGHEQWALDDLAALGVPPDIVLATRPVPACAAMIGYEYYIAGHANPVGLFGWLYTLEAMGDDLGTRIAQAIGPQLQATGGRGLKFLAGHGEADHEHTADLTRMIAAHLTDPTDRADVDHVADVVGELYVGMFRQIGERVRGGRE